MAVMSLSLLQFWYRLILIPFISRGSKDVSMHSDEKTSVPKIKVSLNGPYIVTGNVPLMKMVIETDEEEYPYTWLVTETYPNQSRYSLCRCGESGNKPYCDNSHKKAKFDGTEEQEKKLDNGRIYEGPELRLLDYKKICVEAGFCARAGNIWNLTTHSDNPEFKEIAIQEASECPSGRLILYDKAGNLIEPVFEPSIAITEHENGTLGPIWVRGGILIQSAEKGDYEERNRVTLCRCGRAGIKPLCDGTHLDDE